MSQVQFQLMACNFLHRIGLKLLPLFLALWVHNTYGLNSWISIKPSSTVCDLVLTSILAWVTRIMSPGWQGSASCTFVYRSVTNWGFFACPGSSTDSDATGSLQRAPRQGTKVSPQPVVSRPAARLILLLPRTSSVENEIRTVLHWLDVPARVTFKLCLLAHWCLHGSALPYLVRYFTPVSSIVGR